MTIRVLLIGLLLLWTTFAAISASYPPAEVFHHLNAVAVAVGLLTITAYSPVVVDAWRNRASGLSPAHVLAFGITANWIGFIFRLGRWYLTDAEPANGTQAWFYNIGLFISITAAILLVSALAMSPPKWSVFRVFWFVVALIVLTAFLWLADFHNMIVL